MKPKITSNLMGVYTTAMPEYSVTPNGVPVCKFKTIIDVQDGGHDKPQSYRVTLWRDKAQFFFALAQQFTNKDGKAGVGLQVNAYSSQPFNTYAYARKDQQTGKPMFDDKGNPICDAIIDVTAYDFDVLSALPDNAYNIAKEAVKSGGLQPSERRSNGQRNEARPQYVEDTSDIPF